jgi:serine/threonine protein kinase
MAADTWSIGVILFVFLAGYLPFDEPTMSALFRKIQAADFEYPTWFSNEVKDVLNKILIPDPVKRLTLEQITALDWYNVDGKLYFIYLHHRPLLKNYY